MLDVQQTSEFVKSLICHAPVLMILIDSSNKNKQF